ncbi:HPP family protein [Pseudomonas sp. NPDC090201]|uniref:HPP family protein n=1 Tax=Pseudomonas sp. NPDC090201 TaxID=3364475 RepID=UPI0038001499
MTQLSSTVPGTLATSRRARIGQLLLAGLGAFLALSVVGAVTTLSEQPLLIGSFGASCVLLFGFPKGPFSRVRNVIGGHVLCSTIGVGCLALFGPGIAPMALAVALCVMAMAITGTTHPPAGGNPIIIFMTQPGWTFILIPTLAGAVLLAAIAWMYWKASTWLNAPPGNLD